MSTVTRTLRNLWRVGIRDAAHQLQNIGDTKAGILIGTDRLGNKYYEAPVTTSKHQELPLRTRWVDYANSEYSPDQIEPGWHNWMSYSTDLPPTEDPLSQTMKRVWELKEHKPVMTLSRSAYRPYSTTKVKIASWEPVSKARS
ncbi:putative NADH-ubiquinone oxidoreductase subunit B17.2 [Microthyrium microscopicum]|uniref:NADH dehydrogenase [ubiquinone] 1 alpha subcomplex subunit n=1 Tax=Microthyrium microscopicum TaxID=703497 RepID=A0A6A6UAX6_9PEZI|nr:putative NADH-ubiquinone oxidoreductase subunit B17.2 [Microthyrium microscopicum]